jgi:hypothetical protein
MEANILSLAQTSSTWSYTNLIYKQFAGMMEGYAFAAPNDMVKISRIILYLPLLFKAITNLCI